MNSGSRATGAMLGLAGGVAGVVAMEYVMKGTSRLFRVPSGGEERQTMSLIGERRRRGETATTALGRSLFTKVMRREPGGREKQLLGTAVHWGFGLAMAAGYGLSRGRSRHPAADLAGGALFGVGLWGLGDELLVPLLGYGDRPGAVPVKKHAQALVGHLGYGVVTATTVQGLRRLLATLEERRARGEPLVPSPDAREIRERLAARVAR